jgi:hypothetical protein
MLDDEAEDDSIVQTALRNTLLPGQPGNSGYKPAKLPQPGDASGKPKGLPKQGQEAKSWARKFTDSPGWNKMVQFWVDNPEMMPPGVFSTIMFYRYGKPPQTVRVKGEIMARPYLGDDFNALELRARQLAERLAQLQNPASKAKLIEASIVESGEDDE